MPGSVTASVGENFSLSISIDTKDYTVSAAELHLTYDSTKLEAQAINAGNFLPVVLTQGQVGNGKASIILGSQPTSPQKGAGILATLTLKALAAGASSVDFSADTQVAAVEGTANMVESMTGSNVVVTSGVATSTPSPSASPTPSPPPSATPKSSPTASPTGTANPNPTAFLNLGSSSPTPTATGGVAAGTLSVTSIQNGETIETLKPTISGKAAPYATITITLRSTTQTGTVTADASGNWVWTPTSALDPGSHSVIVASGSQTKTVNFTVGASTPATGFGEATVVLAILGFLGLLSAFLLAF